MGAVILEQRRKKNKKEARKAYLYVARGRMTAVITLVLAGRVFTIAGYWLWGVHESITKSFSLPCQFYYAYMSSMVVVAVLFAIVFWWSAYLLAQHFWGAWSVYAT